MRDAAVAYSVSSFFLRCLQTMDIASGIFASEEVQKHIRTAANHLGPIVYNEISVYIWFIFIYNMLLLFLLVVNLYMNIVLLRKQERANRVLFQE